MIGAFLVLFWVVLAVSPRCCRCSTRWPSRRASSKPPDAGQGRRHSIGSAPTTSGRDVLSRLIWGSRLVLVWATLATVVAYAVGMVMGVVAGYRGGWWDEIISFFGNVLLSFPLMVLYIVIISRFGPASEFGQYLSHDLGLDPVLTAGVIIILAVTFGTAPQVARIVRGLVLDLKTRDYIAAAEVRGESPWSTSCLSSSCPMRAARSSSMPACGSAMSPSPSRSSAICRLASRRPSRTGAR